MTKNIDFVNGGSDIAGDEPRVINGVQVVRNRYDGDSVDQPVEEGEDFFDGNDGERAYSDPAIDSGYEPGLSVEFVGSASPDLVLDVEGDDAFVGDMVEVVRGEAMTSVEESPVMGDELTEVMKLQGAEKVLSIKNAQGQEFAVVLIASDMHNGAMGSLVYERKVFLGGREVPMDNHDMLDFSDFELNALDSTLVAEMFNSFGKLMKSDLSILKVDVEMWTRFLDHCSAEVAALEIDDLIAHLRINFSELSKVKSLVGGGQIFAKIMPNTPMHNMITHMVQGPCRTIDGAIDFLMDAQDADDLHSGLGMLHKGVDRLLVCSTQFLPLIAKHGVNPHPLNIQELAERLRSVVGDEEDQRRIEVDVNPQIVGFFSEAFLLPILENACFNAIKFGGKVRIVAEEYQGAVVVRVHDDAPDMPMSTLDRLFSKPVDPAQPVMQGVQKGSGMGSFIARKIMDDMRISDVPGADKFGIRFVQEPGLKFFELTMPAYGYSQAAYLHGLNRRANNEQVNIEAAA